MPTLLEHKNKYEHTRRFQAENVFNGTQYDDWKAVCMFYEAVHILEAYFSIINKHPYGHSDRESLIKQDAITRSIQDEYNDLYTLSCQARYKAWRVSTAQMCAACDDLRAISRAIIPIVEGHIA